MHLLDKYSKLLQNARYTHREKSDKFHVHGHWESHSFVMDVNYLFMHLEMVGYFQSKGRLGKIRVLRHGVQDLQSRSPVQLSIFQVAALQLVSPPSPSPQKSFCINFFSP